MRKLKNQELGRMNVDEFKESTKIPIVIILDNIRSAYNVGSIFRTADAFRVQKLFLCGITGTPPNKEIQKTALGAADSVEWEYAPNSYDIVILLKNQGFLVYVVEQADGSILLQEFQPGNDTKIALVFGHEVFGVEQKVVDIADGCIEIPQFGTKHSFNVSVSVGIVLWDLFIKFKKGTVRI